MSETLLFATGIKNSEQLAAACERMRSAGLAVVGPRHVTNFPGSSVTEKRAGYTVRLPQWSRDCFFACDETGTMAADNYSPYYDERRVDPVTGQRIPNSGRVHPDVLAGRKQVGEDGRWGDISYLRRLVMEYNAVPLLAAVGQVGGSLASQTVDADCQCLELIIDIPEEIQCPA